MRRCIVFGGSGTLGRVVCERLVTEGARVGLTYHRNADVACALASKYADCILARALDLTRCGDIAGVLAELASTLGGVDAFVHCAAMGSVQAPARFERISEVDEAGFDRLMAVNVKSAFFACQDLAQRMEGKGGNIVLLGSVDGVKGLPAPVPYASSKAALVGMARTLAKELGPKNIRVNVVAPGILESGLSITLPEDLRKEYLKHCGLKRLGRLDEVAALVAWMALDNSYVTGQTVVVDGGL